MKNHWNYCHESIYSFYSWFQSKDPRLKVSFGSAIFMDVRESDEGTFSTLLSGFLPSTADLRVIGKNITQYCILKECTPSEILCANTCFLFDIFSIHIRNVFFSMCCFRLFYKDPQEVRGGIQHWCSQTDWIPGVHSFILWGPDSCPVESHKPSE